MKKNVPQENDEIFNSLALNMQDGVLVNLEGKHVFINNSLSKMLGYGQAHDLIGSTIQDLVHPDEIEKVLARFRSRQNGEQTDNQYETILVTKNGELINVEISASITLWKEKKSTLVIIRNLTFRKQLNQELHNLKSTLDQTLDCVFMFDFKSLRFNYVNEGALNQVGYTREEMFSMTPYDIKPELPEHEFRLILEPLISGEQRSINFETVHQHKNGDRLPVDIFLQLIKLDEEHTHYVAIVRDITERKRVEAELENYRHHLEELVIERTTDLATARDAAEQANIAKSEFLSHMSHELRTPMNAILGFGQILKMDENELSQSQQTDVEEILDAANHLMNLINEILDLARIESGKIDIEMKAIDLKIMLQQCITLITPEADSRLVELVDNISNKGFIILGDFTRVKQIILNLLSNAIKYNSDQGQITLDANLTNNQQLRISITDTGDGISSDDIKKLFVPFERLDKVNNVEGTGIGLTISKRLVDLMGGNIGVESTPGVGSTFWLELELFE